MLRLIFAYTLGVAATLWLPALPPAWSGLLALAAALWPWRYRAVVGALSLGFALTLWRAELQLADRWPLARPGAEVTTRGQIVSLPERSLVRLRDDDDAPAEPLQVWRFTFTPDDAALPARIRTSWYRTPEIARGGDCWQFTLKLKAPQGSQNPGGFDYEGYLFRQGIGATATVRAAHPCGASPWGLATLRQSIRDALERAAPESEARALLIALVLGDTSALRDADWDAFRLTGTTHLIAISGFNLAIVAGVVFALLRWAVAAVPALTRRLPAQRLAAAGAAFVATVYALLAGFEAPVARALAMLLFGLAALYLHRRVAPLRLLALAWGAIVLGDPFALLSAGFWLSFGAVAAILWLAGGRLGREPGWRAAVRVQLWLALLLAPLTLLFFQGSSVVAPFVNLLAVPWFALLTPLALLATLLTLTLPAVGSFLLGLLLPLLAATHDVLQALALSHADHWLAAAPGPAAAVLALVGALLLTAPRAVPLRLLGAVALIPLLLPASPGPTRGFTLTALDVGQGLAVVIRTAHHSLLFDAGPAYEEGFDAGRAVVVPYLLGQGVRQLDTLLISHGDLDHRGGAPAVRAVLRPAEERGALAGTPCVAGQQWDWDGVRFEILNGPADAAGERSPDNNGGCVLRIVAGSHAALLPADIEKEAEARLLATMPDRLKADVLLAPHHGSRTSSTAAFVDAVNPEQVLFAAGYANSYHHPRPEVVERYRRLGSAVHMTGHEGALTLHIDPERGPGPVEARREAAPRWWQAAVLPVPGSE